jgi:hypothetical protein
MWQVQSIHKCSKCGGTDNKRDSKIKEEYEAYGYQYQVIEQKRICNECGHEAVEGILTTQGAIGRPMTVTIKPPEYVQLF